MAGKMVEFPSNGHSAKGYLAMPAAGKGPGVIVIQEWWGLVGHIKSVCDRFAAAGYSALAPDLYHGQTATEPDAAGKPVEIHIYPGVDHGFFNDERPDVYNKPAAEDAWRRTLDLFKKNLK